MTLHDAIIKVLLDANTPLQSGDIAKAINERKLYVRKDGQLLSSSQVIARVNNYPELLKIDAENKIEIVNRALHSFRITYYHIINRFKRSRLSAEDIKFLAACTIYVEWLNPERGQIKHNPDKPDFIQYFHEMVASLRPREAMRSYLSLLDQLTAFELHEISQFIHTPPNTDNVDTQSFGSFFNSIINEYNSGENWKSAQFSAPSVISKFAAATYEINRRGKIFDPFAGYGGTLIEAFKHNFDQGPKIVAGDINVQALQIAEINALANGCGREYFYHKNAFVDWGNSIEADLIVSVPPIGLKVPIYDLHNKFKELDEILIETAFAFTGTEIKSELAAVLVAVAHLNPRGKIAIVVPNGVLYGTGLPNYHLKHFLVSNHLVDGVVALPDGAFRPLHSVACSLLLVNMQREEQKKIFFCDLSKLSLEKLTAEYPKVVAAFKNNWVYGTSSRWVDEFEVIESDCNLDARRQVSNLSDEEGFVSIDEIANVNSGTGIPGANINREGGIPFIQIGDLEDTPGINEINSSRAEYFISDEKSLPRKPKYIPDRAVLISKIGAKLKASLYRYNSDALCNPNVIVIKADESKILPEYLITQLQSDYVLRQIDAIRHGAAVVMFSQADFVKVKIRVPSIEEQRTFVTSFYGRKLKESEIATEQTREVDFYNIVANIKHELKQPVSSLKMDIGSLIDFISEKIESGKSLAWDEPIVHLLPGETKEDAKDALLENVLKRMSSAATGASETLVKTEELLNIGRGAHHAEKFYLKTFLNTLIRQQFSNENCTINIIGDDYEIVADKYQLEVLFKRLIENAVKHGFRKNSDKTSNIINIKLLGKTPNKAFNEIFVENNGAELPDGFDINKFQNLGHTSNRKSGSGFGGFHIKRIIESHKGEIYIADKSEVAASQFKVRFKIYLP